MQESNDEREEDFKEITLQNCDPDSELLNHNFYSQFDSVDNNIDLNFEEVNNEVRVIDEEANLINYVNRISLRDYIQELEDTSTINFNYNECYDLN
jgi:hypothetical protein